MRRQAGLGAHRRRLWLLSLVTALFWASACFYLQILPPYILELGGGVAMVGLVAGAYGFTQLLLRIPLGIWSDRAGRRMPFITAGFMIAALSALMFVRAAEPMALFWARALAGASSATWVVVVVYAAALFPEEPAMVTGRLFAVFNLSQLATSALGARMSASWGWQAPFWASLAAAIAGLGLLPLLGREDGARGQEPGWRGSLGMLSQRPVILPSLLGLVLQYGYFTTTSFAPLLATRLGWDRADLSWLSLMNMGPSIAASMLVDRAVALLDVRYTLAAGFAALALGAVAAPLCRGSVQFCLALALSSLARGFVYPLLMNLSIEKPPPEQKGTAMGVFQAVYSIGMVAGPALTGVLAGPAGGFYVPFFLSGLLMLAAGMIPALIIGWGRAARPGDRPG